MHHATNVLPASRIKHANVVQNPGRYTLSFVMVYDLRTLQLTWSRSGDDSYIKVMQLTLH